MDRLRKCGALLFDATFKIETFKSAQLKVECSFRGINHGSTKREMVQQIKDNDGVKL